MIENFKEVDLALRQIASTRPITHVHGQRPEEWAPLEPTWDNVDTLLARVKLFEANAGSFLQDDRAKRILMLARHIENERADIATRKRDNERLAAATLASAARPKGAL